MQERKPSFWIDGIEFGQGALLNRPQHAAILGRIFTSWSMIEGLMASLLGLLMHADDRAALAILETFRTNQSRVQAVRKVAKRMLPPDKYDDFDALTNLVLNYAKERNLIAHSVWGAYIGLPQAEREIFPGMPDERSANDAEENGTIYRMPMSVLSDLMVDIDMSSKLDTATMTAELHAKMTRVSVVDLEQIEKRGHLVMRQVMGAVTQKRFTRTVEVQFPSSRN